MQPDAQLPPRAAHRGSRDPGTSPRPPALTPHSTPSYDEFKALNCEVLGVSVDSQFSHLAWIQTGVRRSGAYARFCSFCVRHRPHTGAGEGGGPRARQHPALAHRGPSFTPQTARTAGWAS